MVSTLNFREKLIQEINKRCVKKGGAFKLASGAVSQIYVDSKGITLHAPLDYG